MNWPETTTGGRLGDDRHAWATDRPESPEALQEIVSRRVAEGHALYPQGGATSLDYGGTPRAPGVAIDLRGLDAVIDYPASDMTITVQAGMTLAALQGVLATNQQRLSLDAPQADRATLGGIYACNASGPRRFGGGRPRDQIIGVSFVTADGSLVKGGGRVVKNVAGYDFPKLMTGSMGTLGVITQLTLKVRPAPAYSAIACFGLKQSDLASALDLLNTSSTRPVCVELFNAAGASRLGANLDVSAPCLLAIGFEGVPDTVAWELANVAAELKGMRTTEQILRGTEAAPLWSGLTEFPAAEIGPLGIVVNLRQSAVPAFIAGLQADRWAVGSHAGNGIVRAHALGQPSFEDLAAEVNHLRAESVRQGGNLILSRCPSAWKERLRVWGEPRGDWSVAELVKRTLDPRGVMNPGRFVGTI